MHEVHGHGGGVSRRPAGCARWLARVPVQFAVLVGVGHGYGGAAAGRAGLWLPRPAELQHVPVEHVVVREALLVEQVAEEVAKVTETINSVRKT